MLVLLILCLFFYHFCDPCALLPDVPEIASKVLEIYYPNLLTYFVLLVLIRLLLNVSGEFVTNVRYIPFNISLNMLIQRKIDSSSHFQYFYLILIATLLTEEVASAVACLENPLLDKILLHFLITAIFLNLSMLKAAYHYTLFIIRNHAKVFSPCFCNSELSALWLLILILQLSSDVHPNPGPNSKINFFSDDFPQPWCHYHYQLLTFWIFLLLILQSHDVHPNPGPRHLNSEFSNGFLSFCNWNLNTLSLDNFRRVSLLEAHNTIFKYDIISLCETSLNDDIQVPEGILPGYQYHPLNHPDGRKSGGVGIFSKKLYH